MMDFSNLEVLLLFVFLSAAALLTPQLKFCKNELDLLEPMKLLLFSPPKVYY